MQFDAPDQAASAIFFQGTLQATFPGLPYRRIIRAIQVNCTASGPVFIYIDAITPTAQIALNANGRSNTWGPVNTRPIPYNSTIIVVWTAATSTDSATAVISAWGEV